MPVQRVPRYKVLIEELLKLTPNHFPDKELLEQAFKSIKETATFIDETIRFKEGLTSVCLLVESIFYVFAFGAQLVKSSLLYIQTKKLCDRFKPPLAWLVQPGRALVMSVIHAFFHLVHLRTPPQAVQIIFSHFISCSLWYPQAGDSGKGVEGDETT